MALVVPDAALDADTLEIACNCGHKSGFALFAPPDFGSCISGCHLMTHMR